MWTSDAVLGVQNLPCLMYKCVSEAACVSEESRPVMLLDQTVQHTWHYIMGSFSEVQWFPYVLEKKMRVLTSFPAGGAYRC